MPELTQNFTLPFPRSEVWRAFQEAERVVGCMPGASLDTATEGNRLHGQMRVKLGPITANFAGEAEMVMDETQWSGVIRGKGLDQKNNSRAHADLGFQIVEQAPGTRVDITVDYSLAGPLAQFGRGAIVQAVAQRLTEEFARNLATELERSRGSVETSEPRDRPPEPRREALGLASLLWSLLVGWLRRSFGRLVWWRRADSG
jgi:uncharacterized protein